VGIKILLADDSVTAQNMGKKILSEAGHEVVTVSNGAAAARKIAELKPELVLLDVFMPGYSGLELCEKLRNAAETAKLPVLLTVGKLEPHNPQEVSRVRADGLIIKPFEASDLTAAVDRLAQKLKSGKPKASENKPAMKTAPSTHDEEGESAASTSRTQKPKDYEPTMLLDSSQIAAMLKVAKTEKSSAQTMTSEQEFDGVEPAHSAEEFSVIAPDGAGPSANANLPAFGGELNETASSEIPSYMAQYFPDDSAAAASLPEPFPTASPAEQSASSLPSFEPLPPPESPYMDDLAATIVIPKGSVLERFDPQTTPEATVAPADGLELTSAAPIADVPIASEAGFEPTLQSSDPATTMFKDPALVTDPHRSSMDFVTQFGTSESGLADDVIQSMSAPAEEKNSSADEFEARLNAAMSAFAEPSPELPSFVTGDPISAEPVDTESPSLETLHAGLPPHIEPQAPILEAQIERDELPPSIEALPSFHESNLHLVNSGLGPSAERETEVREPDFTPVSQEPAVSEPAKLDEPYAVSAVSHTVVTRDQSEVASISMETTAAPETDETVIQQMRDAFSELPVEHPHSNDQFESEPAPMAMAAAASATAPASTAIGQEAEVEIARALSAAVGAEISHPHSASGQVTEISPSSDANTMAAAVEKVMQRELPNLIWKIMAELDLRKRS